MWQCPRELECFIYIVHLLSRHCSSTCHDLHDCDFGVYNWQWYSEKWCDMGNMGNMGKVFLDHCLQVDKRFRTFLDPVKGFRHCTSQQEDDEKLCKHVRCFLWVGCCVGSVNQFYLKKKHSFLFTPWCAHCHFMPRPMVRLTQGTSEWRTKAALLTHFFFLRPLPTLLTIYH